MIAGSVNVIGTHGRMNDVKQEAPSVDTKVTILLC